jgi:hypothetical protein
MKPIAAAIAAATLSVLCIFGGNIASAAADEDHGAQRNPCAVPNEIVGSVEETAWQIWVAATCPVNKDQYPFVVWENWIEQAQLYPTDPSQGLKVPNSGAATAQHPLHSSPLALTFHPESATLVPPGVVGAPNTNCNAANAPPSNNTPPNGNNPLTICEEVRENGATEDYIAGTGFWDRANQAAAAGQDFDIQFSRPSVEIKADWIQVSTIGNHNYTCDNIGQTGLVHVETVNGNCFALVGMHLISKLLDKWIWATFEPQNTVTNPFRCQVLGCNDPFGSQPSQSNGKNTNLTRALKKLMEAAGLASEWYNYRLDAVQTDFFRPKLLGNSIIEGENVGMNLTQASCITCHAVSSVKSNGTDGINILAALNPPPTGVPPALPSRAWIHRDFVWSLGLACPNGPTDSKNPIGSLQNCTSGSP